MNPPAFNAELRAQALRRAHQLRDQAIGDALGRLWSVLRRPFATARKAGSQPCHS